MEALGVPESTKKCSTTTGLGVSKFERHSWYPPPRNKFQCYPHPQNHFRGYGVVPSYFRNKIYGNDNNFQDYSNNYGPGAGRRVKNVGHGAGALKVGLAAGAWKHQP
ncbi:hypothetical protein SLE2022_154100 [Rubroshorea leprosula]